MRMTSKNRLPAKFHLNEDSKRFLSLYLIAVIDVGYTKNQRLHTGRLRDFTVKFGYETPQVRAS